MINYQKSIKDLKSLSKHIMSSSENKPVVVLPYVRDLDKNKYIEEVIARCKELLLSEDDSIMYLVFPYSVPKSISKKIWKSILGRIDNFIPIENEGKLFISAFDDIPNEIIGRMMSTAIKTEIY